MTQATNSGPAPRKHGRTIRWTAAGTLLLVPYIMMQVSSEWEWTIGDFLVAGVILGGLLLLYDYAERAKGGWAWRGGVAVALLTSLVTVWSTIVRDDGNGGAFLLLVMSAMTAAVAAGGRAANLARGMAGVAIMQAVIGLAMATAPATAIAPSAVFNIVLAAAVFTILWLVSAGLFAIAARDERGSQYPVSDRPGSAGSEHGSVTANSTTSSPSIADQPPRTGATNGENHPPHDRLA